MGEGKARVRRIFVVVGGRGRLVEISGLVFCDVLFVRVPPNQRRSTLSELLLAVARPPDLSMAPITPPSKSLSVVPDTLPISCFTSQSSYRTRALVQVRGGLRIESYV